MKKGGAFTELELLHEINAYHAGKCSSVDWTKDGGEFAKSLENWLAPTMDR